MSDGNGGKIAILCMFGLAIVGAFAFVFLRVKPTSTDVVASAESPGAPIPNAAPQQTPATVTHISFMYSTEKKAWLSEALGRFAKEHPEVAVDVKEKGSFDMVQALLDQGERPTVVSPADDVALALLTSDWKQKNGTELIANDGPDKPAPLVLTPLVFVAWEDRANALVGNEKTLSFKHLYDAIKSPKGWPGAGGKAEWGFVKLGHTNPSRSNSGLQALILMASEFHKKTTGLEVKDVLDEKFQDFMKTIEKGVPKFGDSTGTFMQEMVLYGPSKYDVVVTYENLAIQNIPNAQGRWGNLRVFYPQRTMWSNHPIAVLVGDWITPAQRKAASILVQYLRDKPEQQRALVLGFRPGNPEVPVLASDGSSPFKNASAFGVRADIGSIVEAPPAPVIQNLMELWSRQIAR